MRALTSHRRLGVQIKLMEGGFAAQHLEPRELLRGNGDLAGLGAFGGPTMSRVEEVHGRPARGETSSQLAGHGGGPGWVGDNKLGGLEQVFGSAPISSATLLLLVGHVVAIVRFTI